MANPQSDPEKDMLLLKHKFKMEEMAFERETNRLFHEMELERIRIKSAEIRKQFERKQNEYFAQKYASKRV